MSGEQSSGRMVVLLLAGFTGLQVGQGVRPLLMASLLAAGLIAAVVAVLRAPGSTSARRPWGTVRWARGVVLFGVVVTFLQAITTVTGSPVIMAVTMAVVLAVGIVAIFRADAAAGRSAFVVLLIGFAAIGVLTINTASIEVDVKNYLNDAASDVVSGSSPYGGTVENPYSAAQSELYFHPGAVVGERILIGFPYLPAVIAFELPGYLLGDVRYAHLACLVLATGLLRRLASDETGRVLALLPVASPLTMKVLISYWVEPVVMLMLLMVAVAAHDKRRNLGVASVALLLLSKQYLAAVLPFLLVVGRRLGFGPVLVSIALASAVILGFFVWEPRGFWNDVILFQFQQPFRRDSISMTTALWNGDTAPPSWVTGSLPLVAGLALSGLISLRLQPNACTAMLSVGLGLLVTVLLSKQAFPNYYALVQVALAAAVVTWPRHGVRHRRGAPAVSDPG